MGALHLFDIDTQQVRSVIRVVDGKPVIDSGGEDSDLELMMSIVVTKGNGHGHVVLTPKDGDEWLMGLAAHLRSYIVGEYVDGA